MSEHPVISIITPSYNRAGFIKYAIDSVIAQHYPNIEHIVVDGSSTDGTLEILLSYPHLRVISERDCGMYDALNKGIAIARGEIIGLINTDDLYEVGAFDDVAEVFVNHPGVDVVIGRAVVFEGVPSKKSYFEECPHITGETLLDQLISGVPAINAWFFRREIFERMGTFDQTYAIGADRDFLIRLYLSGFKPVFVDKVYYSYRRHSGSLTIGQGSDVQERVLLENRCLAQKYISILNNDPVIHKRIRTWHDLISIELMILFARQKRFIDLVDVIRIAVKHNWFWLFLVATQSPLQIKNYLKKKYGSHR